MGLEVVAMNDGIHVVTVIVMSRSNILNVLPHMCSWVEGYNENRSKTISECPETPSIHHAVQSQYRVLRGLQLTYILDRCFASWGQA